MGPVPPWGRGPHVFVDDLDDPVLTEADHLHLSRSLRLRPGDALTVSDGHGRWRTARFGPTPEPDGPMEQAPAAEPPVVIGLTPVKGQRPEWAVQKLTELGVDAIWLLVADRSVVRWQDERAVHHLERLSRVAREAAMQSRRTTLPDLRTGVPVAEVLAAADAGGAGSALVAHPGGGAPALGAPVLVGPEGGWSDEELAMAPRTVGLGPTVLRAETAAVALASLLTALRAGVVGPSPTAPVTPPASAPT